jgi:excinuclease ABC subunit A
LKFHVLLLSDGGGEIVAVGTQEDVAKEKRSYTRQYLNDVLKRPRKEAAE